MQHDSGRAGVLRRPRMSRNHAGSSPKSFLFTNSITKTTLRTLHDTQSSKHSIPLFFTTKLTPRKHASRPSSPRISSLSHSSAGSASGSSPLSSPNSTTHRRTHRPARGRAPGGIAHVASETSAASPPPPRYELHVVQNPVRTAEFGSAILSRLPLSPSTVVQLTVRDGEGNSIMPEEEIPFLLAHLSLCAENGTLLDMGSSLGLRVGAPPPILYGNLISSLQHLEDHNGNSGLYFVFPDVSIRWRGRYQLGIHLVKISRPDSNGLAEQATALAHARTSTFDVVPYDEEYIVPPQTRLTQVCSLFSRIVHLTEVKL
uniref:Velvet domain-containing protein n=1 Tax=Mycena chlorophos TaxID=658473 RepID=A0ABQ0KVG4_MYCCL|nr:predicted protein [Mycena chlorophos]